MVDERPIAEGLLVERFANEKKVAEGLVAKNMVNKLIRKCKLIHF